MKRATALAIAIVLALLASSASAIEPAADPESMLSQVPETRAEPGVPLRKGLYWVGMDGAFANSEIGIEHVQFIRRYVPDILAVMVTNHPEQLANPDYYRRENIPTLPQSHGQPSYVPYFHQEGAFEINWEGLDLGEPGVAPLAGSTHAASKAHPAVRHAFERITRSAIRSGFSGFGYHDMVWMWGGGRGRSGYNPVTIEAFRRSLLAEDDGVMISLDGGPARLFMFEDYARHYFGGMPRPRDLGFETWRDYHPVTKEQHDADPDRDWTPHFVLFDMLKSYEWLKFGDFLGRVAEEEGGSFQVMPNPEDMANGADFRFGSSAVNIRAMSEEAFNTPAHLDGAYHRMPYLRAPRLGTEREAGIVVETGHGGNSWPYWDKELSYLQAYELAAGMQADHLEGDFWPGRQQPMSETAQAEIFKRRMQVILAFGLGFRHMWEDQPRRIEPEFISVTARRIFRPWGEPFQQWSWLISDELSPEPAMASLGYSFTCIGEEGLGAVEGPQKLVVYTPSIPTQQGWERLVEMLEGGQVEQVITVAPALREVITRDLRRQPFAELFPAVRVEQLEDESFAVADAEVTMQLDDHPVVATLQIGQGTLHIVLFDPETDRERGRAVYDRLLSQAGFSRHWIGEPERVMARIYRSDVTTIVGVQSDRARDWQSYEKVLRERGPDAARTDYLPYRIEGRYAVQVRLEPDREYEWLSLPNGARGEAAADEAGLLELSFENTSHELFYILPAGEESTARLDEIAERKTVLDDAFTLDGLVDPDWRDPQ